MSKDQDSIPFDWDWGSASVRDKIHKQCSHHENECVLKLCVVFGVLCVAFCVLRVVCCVMCVVCCVMYVMCVL